MHSFLYILVAPLSFWFSPLEEALARLFAAEQLLFVCFVIVGLLLYVAFHYGRRLIELRIADSLRTPGAVEIVKSEALQIGMEVRLELPGSNTGRAITAGVVSLQKGLVELECSGLDPDSAIRAGTPIHAVVAVRSALLYFETKVKDCRRSASGLSVFVARPPSLYRLQRREYFRVPVELPALVSICGHSSLNDLMLRGKLDNLSAGGFRIALPTRLDRDTSVQVMFQDAELQRASFKALVRSSTVADRRDALPFTAQCEFVDIDEATRNEIVNYCFRIEKEEHRKSKFAAQ